jgi:hypothetical protein
MVNRGVRAPLSDLHNSFVGFCSGSGEPERLGYRQPAIPRPSSTTRSPVSLFAGRSVWVTPGSGARAPAGSNPARPGAPLVRIFFDRFPRAEATGLSLKTNGPHGLWQARACNSRGTPRPQFLARAARRSSASPTRKSRLVRFHPRARTHARMPPFHGWDAALRTLTARVQVLPAVPLTPRVAVWDQPGLQNRAGGVRSLGDLQMPR